MSNSIAVCTDNKKLQKKSFFKKNIKKYHKHPPKGKTFC